MTKDDLVTEVVKSCKGDDLSNDWFLMSSMLLLIALENPSKKRKDLHTLHSELLLLEIERQEKVVIHRLERK